MCQIQDVFLYVNRYAVHVCMLDVVLCAREGKGGE